MITLYKYDGSGTDFFPDYIFSMDSTVVLGDKVIINGTEYRMPQYCTPGGIQINNNNNCGGTGSATGSGTCLFDRDFLISLKKEIIEKQDVNQSQLIDILSNNQANILANQANILSNQVDIQNWIRGIQEQIARTNKIIYDRFETSFAINQENFDWFAQTLNLITEVQNYQKLPEYLITNENNNTTTTTSNSTIYNFCYDNDLGEIFFNNGFLLGKKFIVNRFLINNIKETFNANIRINFRKNNIIFFEVNYKADGLDVSGRPDGVVETQFDNLPIEIFEPWDVFSIDMQSDNPIYILFMFSVKMFPVS